MFPSAAKSVAAWIGTAISLGLILWQVFDMHVGLKESLILVGLSIAINLSYRALEIRLGKGFIMVAAQKNGPLVAMITFFIIVISVSLFYFFTADLLKMQRICENEHRVAVRNEAGDPVCATPLPGGGYSY